MDKSLLAQIEDMAVFTTVVEQGSFSGAARRLGLAKSAVSKRVVRLEENLGVRLLNRSTRSLSMTEAGKVIQERASQSLSLLAEARDRVANLVEAPRGLLRVTASVAFGRLCLAPLLPEFLRTYPEIRIQLTLLDRMVDLAEEGYDVAIRLTRSLPDFVVAKALMPIDYVVCASPAYLRGKAVGHPAELVGLNCLYYGYQGFTDEWTFVRALERETVKVESNIVVNSSEVVRHLMLDGVGIGLVARYTVAEELRSGSLQRLLPEWQPVGPFGQTAYAIWLPQIHLPPKVRAFVDFMTSRLGRLAVGYSSQ